MIVSFRYLADSHEFLACTFQTLLMMSVPASKARVPPTSLTSFSWR